MDFTQEKHGIVLVEVVNLTRATMKEAEEFKQIIRQDIESGWRKIIVDLSDCEFIDSTFLGVLVISLKRITGLGGDIRLVGVHSDVDSMFQLTRMSRVFETFKTRNNAIKSFIRSAEGNGDNEFNGPIFSDDKIIPFEKLKEESIRHALRVTNGNIVEAARKLKLSKASIHELMEKYNIEQK
jgi:anti-sigma B factor antagonist